MPPPTDQNNHSRSAISVQTWTWAAVVVSMALCLILYWLHYHQEDTLRRSRRLFTNLREARMDLARGFIRLNLAEDPGSPFHREEGIALLDQSMAALREAQTQITPTTHLGPEATGLVRTFQAKAGVFREHLAAYHRAEAKARQGLTLPLRLAFHELEELAQRLDYLGQIAQNKLADRLDFFFTVTLGGSVALLGVMCLGVFQVGRRQQQAEAALRQSEAQLRTLGDNIPGGALYQLLMAPDGRNHYTHVSAGFEKIFGMPVERILADPKAFWELIVEEDRPRLFAEEQRCAHAMAVFDLEFRQRSLAGEVKWIHARSTPRPLADGSILWDGVAADVTERKAVAAALERTKNLLSEGQRIAHLGTWEYVAATQTTVWSDEQKRIYGLDPSQPSPNYQAMLEHSIHPDDAAALDQSFREALHKGGVFENENRIVLPDGRVRHIINRALPYFGEDGKLVRYIGTTLDITERKQLEERLRESERRHALLFEKSSTPTVLLKLPEVVIVDANEACTQLTGFTREELCGRTAAELGLTSQEARQEAISRFDHDGKLTGMETRLLTKSGTERIVVSKTNPLQIAGQMYAITTLQDITERQAAENALRENEERLQFVLQGSQLGLWDWNMVTGEVQRNERWAEMLGFTIEEINRTVKQWSELIHPDERAAALKSIDDHLQGRTEGHVCEYRMLTKSGDYRWILDQARVMARDAEGRPLRMSGTHTDIHKRKQSEEALRQSEARLDFALRAGHIGAWSVNLRDRTATRNLIQARIFGYENTEGAWTLEKFFEHVHPEDRDRVRGRIQEGILKQQDWEIECRIRRTDGQVRWILAAGGLEHTMAEPRSRISGIVQDITERKEIEKTLRESELKHRTLFESSRDAIMTADPATHQFINCNPAALKMFGVESEAELNARGRAGFSPERQPDGRLSADVVKEMDAVVMQKGGCFLEWQHRRVNGEIFYADVLLTRIEWDGKPVVMSTVRDITERKQAESRLRASEEQVRLKLDSILSPDVELREEELVNLLDIPALQSLMDTFSQLSHAVVAILDTRGKVMLNSGWQDICTRFHRVHPETAHHCTQSDLALSGSLRPGEHIGYHCRNGLWDVVTPLMVGGKHVGNIFTGQFFYEDDVVDEEAFAAQAARCGFEREAYLAALRRVPRVSREWVETLMVFLTKFSELISKSSFSNLKLAKALVQQKRVEDDLRASEEQFRTMFELASIGMAQADPFDARWLRVNRKFCEITGYSESELLQRSVPEITHPDDQAREQELFQRVVRGQAPDYRLEQRYTRKDGTLAWVNVDMIVIRDGGGRPLRTLATIEDITARKRLEQERLTMEAQMRQQQKLESIGTLASGVAHEINNPINGILNYAQLIQDRLPGDSPLTEFTGEIMHETQRVATIVRNLLTFARNEKQSHSPARVADIVEAVLSLVRTVIRHDQIALTVQVPDDLPQMKCRSQQIQQVIMNLVTNARDALNERYPGHHPDKVMSLEAHLFAKAGRRWIRFTVADHGTGIPPEARERLFDPFFTTKGRNQGTGLGLSISHGIVKDHHGEWTVESEPGQFTRMHVDLPVDNGWNL